MKTQTPEVEKQVVTPCPELAKLKVLIASNDAKIKKVKPVKADCSMPVVSYQDFEYCCQQIGYYRDYCYKLESLMYDKLNEVYNALYKHQSNHLPPLNASALEKLLKVAGLDDDYNVQKPVIWVTASKSEKGITEMSYSLKEIQKGK